MKIDRLQVIFEESKLLQFLVFTNAKCNSESMFVIMFRSNQGLIWCLSNRGDEVSMWHVKEIDFWLKNFFFCIGVLKWYQDRLTLVSKLSQTVPPHSHPWRQ